MKIEEIIKRLEEKITQKELAKKLGVSDRYIRYVKTGKRSGSGIYEKAYELYKYYYPNRKVKKEKIEKPRDIVTWTIANFFRRIRKMKEWKNEPAVAVDIYVYIKLIFEREEVTREILFPLYIDLEKSTKEIKEELKSIIYDKISSIVSGINIKSKVISYSIVDMKMEII